MPQEFVETFAEGLRAAQRAFNQRDYESAFATLAPDVEWHFGPWIIDGGVAHSRDEVIHFYRSLEEIGDWQVEALDFIDAGDGRVVVHQRGTWAGRTTRIADAMESFFVYEIGADGLVFRVREYESRGEALEAVGLRE